MSRNRFTWNGLDELKAQLRTLPADLTEEAAQIIDTTARSAEASIKAAYPRRTGKLRDGLSTTRIRSGFTAGAIVKNSSPLAHIFELGTQARHTRIGANRGSMPRGRVFVPRITKARRAVYAALKNLLTRHGLLVSGDA